MGKRLESEWIHIITLHHMYSKCKNCGCIVKDTAVDFGELLYCPNCGFYNQKFSKADTNMDLSIERIVQILDSIDSYALPGKMFEQQEREKALTEASYYITLMSERWTELKDTIEELRDNDGTATQHEVCTFLASLMEVLENGKTED